MQNNLDLNKMYEWPLPTRCAVIALICAVVFFIGYKWDITTLQRKLHLITKEEESKKSEFEIVMKKQSEAKIELLRLEKIHTILGEWQKKLVPFDDMPELLNQILKVGNNNGMYFSLFDPSEAVEENNYQKIPIKVTAAGTYHQLSDFISQVANLPWIVVIDKFTISDDPTAETLGARLADTAKDQDLLTLDLLLNIYYKKPGSDNNAK